MPSVFESSISVMEVIKAVVAVSCVGSAERGGTWRGTSCLELQSASELQR